MQKNIVAILILFVLSWLFSACTPPEPTFTNSDENVQELAPVSKLNISGNSRLISETRVAPITITPLPVSTVAVTREAPITATPTPTATVSVRLMEEAQLGNFTVRVYFSSVEDIGYIGSNYEIWRDGELIFSESGWRFHIYGHQNDEEAFKMGMDLVGNGKQYLVMRDWSGGNGCCYEYHFFELGDDFALLDTFISNYPSLIENVDGVFPYELIALDSTFVFWNGMSRAASPTPKVIFQFRERGLQIAPQSMCQPPLSEEAFEAAWNRIYFKASWQKFGSPPLVLLEHMLELIYNGNMEQAYELFDVSWPDEIEGKEAFLEAFNEQLAKSEYWQDIEAMTCDVT